MFLFLFICGILSLYLFHNKNNDKFSDFSCFEQYQQVCKDTATKDSVKAKWIINNHFFRDSSGVLHYNPDLVGPWD